jgi:hypothetical protein
MICRNEAGEKGDEKANLWPDVEVAAPAGNVPQINAGFGRANTFFIRHHLPPSASIWKLRPDVAVS